MPRPGLDVPDDDATVRRPLPNDDGTVELEGHGPGVEPAPVAPLLKGTLVGRYLILKKLGEGGMGVVYEAFDPELARRVALKLLTPGSQGRAGDLVGRARLLREAQAMALLAHPNVVAVHDVLVDHDQVVMVMELVEGVTFKAWLQARPRSWREVVKELVAAGEGLAAAHDKGLIHRDFKPDNVLIGKDGRTRVADFGIARTEEAASPAAMQEAPAASGLARREGTGSLTQAGLIVGTPSYMAPETVATGSVDGRTDQFSFGVVLFEALYGTRPFRGSSSAERAALIAKGSFGIPAGAPRPPAHLTKVFTRALAADPADRYPSMVALLADLSRDPAAQRRRILVLGTLAFLAASLLLAYVAARRHRAAQCRSSAAELLGIWDGPSRASVVQAFIRSNLPHAQEISAQVTSSLDRFAAEWAAMKTDSCLETRLTGRQSEHVFALRSACLADRLDELRATTRLFRGEPKLLLQGPEAVALLTPVHSCADESLPLTTLKPPAASQQAEVSAVRSALADGRVLRSAGQCDQVLLTSVALLERARRSGYPPVEAATLNLIAGCDYRKNQLKAGWAANWEAMQKAAGGGDERELGQAIINLALHDILLGDAEGASRWVDFAEAIADRRGDPELQFLASSKEAVVRSDLMSDNSGAIENIQRALDIARTHPGVLDPLNIVKAKINLAIERESMGDYAGAVKGLREGLAEHLALVGPRDGELIYATTGLGCSLSLQGQYREAEEVLLRGEGYAASGVEYINLAYTEQCLAEVARGLFDAAASQMHARKSIEISRRHMPEDYVLIFISAAHEAKSKAETGQVAEALKALAPLVRRAETTSDRDPEARSAPELALGEVLRLAGRLPESVSRLQDAIAHIEATKTQQLLPEALRELGLAFAAAGQPKKAEAPLRRAISLLEAAGGVNHPDLVLPLTGLGEVLLARGELAEARITLERTVKLWTSHPGKVRARGDAKVALARTLFQEPSQRLRARALLEDALKDYAHAPFAKDDDGARIERWLAQLEPGAR